MKAVIYSLRKTGMPCRKSPRFSAKVDWGGIAATPPPINIEGLKLVNLSGFLVLPVASQFEREVEFDSPWTGTIVGTATAVPAFLGMKDDGRFALLRMRYINVDLACIHTDVASVANIRIEDHRIIRCSDIRHREYFFLRHVILLIFFYE
jgi:hypothetical protein